MFGADESGYRDGAATDVDVIGFGGRADEAMWWVDGTSCERTEYGEGKVHNEGRMLLGGELGGVNVGMGDTRFGSESM